MSEQISFFNGTDTGEANDESIKPLLSGEPFDATVFNRPIQNLRRRTDELRAEANSVRWVRDADRSAFMYVDGAPAAITWGGTVANAGTGILVLGGGTTLTLVSADTGGVARSAYYEGVGTRYPTRYAHTELTDGVNHIIRVLSDLASFDGGSNISITITDVPASGGINVDVQGDGTVSDPSLLPGADDIVVTYDSGLGHTIASVISAVNAHPAAGALVTLTYAGSGSTTDAMFDVAKSGLYGGLDGVHLRLSAAVLAAFFGASTDNLLAEGDTLAVYFPNEAARRQATQENSDACDLLVGSLVNLSREPEKAPYAVAIGKVLQGLLYLANGFPLTKDATYAAVANTDLTLRADLAKDIASVPAAGANSFGSEIVGVDIGALSAVAPATKDLQTVLESVDTALLNAASDIGGLQGDVIALELITRRVTTLWDTITLPTDLGVSSAVLDGVSFEFNRGKNRPPMLTQLATSTTSGSLEAAAVGGTHWYASDGVSLFAHLIEDVASGLLAVDTSVALADVVEISVCRDTVAVRMSDDTIALYDADLSTTLLAKTDLGLVSGSTISHLVNRGEYLYVASKVEVVPGTFQWNLTGVPTSTFTPATTTMFTDTDTTEYAWLGLEADRRTDPNVSANRDVYVLHTFDGTVTPGYRVRRAVFNGSTFSFSADIGDAGTSPTAVYADGAGFLLMPDAVYVSGRNIDTGGVDVLMFRRSDLSAAPTATAVAVADGGDEQYTTLKADSRFVYALRDSAASTGAKSSVIVYTHDLSATVAILTLDSPTISDIIGFGSTDEYLVVGYQGAGSPEYRAYALNPPSARYMYSDKGRAPLWTHYERME